MTCAALINRGCAVSLLNPTTSSHPSPLLLLLLPLLSPTLLMLPAGYVATDMTAGQPGTIPVTESIAGQLKVLQDGRPLNGKFYSYTGEELPF
jgi:hypothetical protein